MWGSVDVERRRGGGVGRCRFNRVVGDEGGGLSRRFRAGADRWKGAFVPLVVGRRYGRIYGL